MMIGKRFINWLRRPFAVDQAKFDILPNDTANFQRLRDGLEWPSPYSGLLLGGVIETKERDKI